MAGKLYIFSVLICVASILYACNVGICVVSKCLLTQSCKWGLKDCSCYKDCFYCLGLSECCSCVDICSKTNNTQTELPTMSYVEELGDGLPALFEVLISELDPQERWLLITYPVVIDLSAYNRDAENKSVEPELMPKNRNVVTFNCTVLYFSECMSRDTCRAFCRFMSASSIRWFHNGCCACVHDKCLFYGINEIRCLACPSSGNGTAENEDDLTYEELSTFEEAEIQFLQHVSQIYLHLLYFHMF